MKAFDFLAGLYEASKPTGDVITTTLPLAPSPAITTAGTGRPDTPSPSGDVHHLDAWLAAEDFSKWSYRDGRYVGPDANPADDWDSLPYPLTAEQIRYAKGGTR